MSSLPPEPFPGHSPGMWAPCPSRVVASWPVGAFAENLAIDEQGCVFVTLHTDSRIDRYTPATGAVETFARFPAPVAGVAFSADGLIWVSGGTPGQSPGYIWRVLTTGVVEEWAVAPDVVFFNGCTLHPNGKTLLVCESILGRIIEVDVENRNATWTWLAHELIASDIPQVPAANGIKIHDGAAWITNTAKNRLVRVPLLENGAAGTPELVADDVRGDDFAVSASGALLIATHPANSVLRIDASGARTTLAGPAEGAVGSTACAFGRAPGDETTLYVTTNGGLWSPYQGEAQEAKLLRLEVGEAGT